MPQAPLLHNIQSATTSDRRVLYAFVGLVWMWVFGFAVTLSAHVVALDSAQRLGRLNAISALWLWVASVALLGTARLVFRVVRVNNERVQRFYDESARPKGLQTTLAWIVGAAYIAILASNDLPVTLLFAATPVFIPGLAIMWERFSLVDRPGPFPRAITKRALSYSFVTSAAIAAASVVMTDRLGQTTQATALHLLGNASLLDSAISASPALMSFAVLMGVYALVRRNDLSRLDSEMVTAQFEQLLEQAGPDQLWARVGQLIQRHFRFHRVVVIVPDETYRELIQSSQPDTRVERMKLVRFRIAAIAGDTSHSPDKTDYAACGISLRVLLEPKTQYFRDAARKTEYFGNGLDDIRAELYAPVIDSPRSTEVIAIIVAQETNSWAFTNADRDNMDRVARYLASFSNHLQHSSVHHELQQVAARLAKQEDVNGDDLLNAAHAVFRTRCVTTVPLSFATYRPISKSATMLEDGFSAPFSAEDGMHASDIDLSNLIRTWQPLLISKIDPAPTHEKYWHTWALRNRLRGFALVPIGARSGSGALLLIGFRSEISTDIPHLQTLLGAFANTFAPLIDRLWRQWWEYETAFVAPTLEIHQLLATCDLDRDTSRFSKLMEGSARGDKQNAEKLTENLAKLISGLYAIEAVSHPLASNISLSSAIETFVGGLQPRHALNGVRQIDRRIDDESLELRTMLYRVICEAILNSLGHGGARTINIIASRRMEEITVVIQDDGIGFDPHDLDHLDGRRHGITALCRHLSRLAGAVDPDWLWTAKGQGACLKVAVPCLPLSEDLNSESSDIETKIDRLERLYDSHCE